MQTKIFPLASAALLLAINISAQSAATGSINGYEYVDLGLSVKWATCNVGASQPSDYGYYFAWGETFPKSSYNADNCSTKGIEIGNIKGNIAYDAARANWGSTWRLPTIRECNELESCEWIETTINGHKGYKIVGKNGNFIFLPAAGLKIGDSLNYESSHGGFMTCAPFGTDSCWDFFFNIGNNKGVGNGLKEIGRCVRPVSE